MATATIILPINGAELDPTAPPGVEFVNGLRRLLFDDDTPEIARWTFRMPENFASGLVMKLQYATAAVVAGTVSWEVFVMAHADAAAAAVDAESYDAANPGTETVLDTTAGRLSEISIALSNDDSVAPGNWVTIRLEREADDATNDTATGDMELWNVSLEYTTT